MRIHNHLRAEHIYLDASLKDKDELFRFVADTFARDGVVKDSSRLYNSMKMREKTMSTGVGNGIGIPHAASWEAKKPAVLLIRPAKAIDFKALDGLSVDIVLALVVPENQTPLHLQMLAGISRLCQEANLLKLVRQAGNPRDLLKEIELLEKKIAFH